jgi:hypothetical protein
VDRLDSFLAATDDGTPEHVALRTLTLHMLEHVAPKMFARRGLAAVQRRALEACAQIDCGFDDTLDPDRLQAGIDAWFCRHVKGLPHPAPDREALQTALTWLKEDHLIYAWLLGEIAARCGVDVRVPLAEERPFRRGPKLHDAYFLTHLVLLDSDYLARPLSHPKAQQWGEELSALVPWLKRAPNLDLAGEVALCLRFMGLEARGALVLLTAAPIPDDSHAQATGLLALAVE